MENTNKPFGAWTLAEAIKSCLNTACDNCPFYADDCGRCRLYGTPNSWKFDKPKTETTATVEYIHYPAVVTEASNKPAKPRLAEILGVEVGERFRIAVNGGTIIFWVTEKGHFETDPPKQVGSTYMLLDAINHPESIIRAPRLTEAELAICKAVGAKWLTLDCVTSSGLSVYLWDKKPQAHEVKGVGMCYYASDSGAKNVARIDGAVFPGLKPGDCICVEEATKYE